MALPVPPKANPMDRSLETCLDPSEQGICACTTTHGALLGLPLVFKASVLIPHLFPMGCFSLQESPKHWRLIARAMTPKTFLHDACREFSRKDSEDGPFPNDPGRVCPRNSSCSANHLEKSGARPLCSAPPRSCAPWACRNGSRK